MRDVLARVVAALPGAAPAVRQMLGQRVHAADGITWAAVGGGLALPHLRSHVALGRDAGSPREPLAGLEGFGELESPRP